MIRLHTAHSILNYVTLVIAEGFYIAMPTLVHFIQSIEALGMRRRMPLEPPSNFEHVGIECRHALLNLFNAGRWKRGNEGQ